MINVQSLIYILFLLVIIIGLFCFQYKLCKSPHGNKHGLIIPCIGFIFSVLITVSFFSMGYTKSSGQSYDENGNVIGTTYHEDFNPDILGTITLFLVSNLPTGIYLTEYFSVMSQKKKSELKDIELARTQIQDL